MKIKSNLPSQVVKDQICLACHKPWVTEAFVQFFELINLEIMFSTFLPIPHFPISFISRDIFQLVIFRIQEATDGTYENFSILNTDRRVLSPHASYIHLRFREAGQFAHS